MPSVLIIGATSGIGRALATEFARHGHDLVLAGRDLRELQATASDLTLRHNVRASAQKFDVLAFDEQPEALEACLRDGSQPLDGVVMCSGYLASPVATWKDAEEARRVLDTNLTGCVLALNLIADRFEARRRGFICVVSSVAGDRGRQSNYVYGAAKAGLSAYVEGLRQRLFRSGVRVVTIKPGYVDTPMTYGRPGLFLVASAESVAASIFAAIERGKDVAYVPWFWRPIMFVVRTMPEWLFKRLRL